jgi:hypothetical protein
MNFSSFVLSSFSLQVESGRNNLKKLNKNVKEMLATVKELVKQVTSLVKVLGEKPTYSPAGKASSGMLKDEVDGELLKELSHPQLIALYEKFIRWELKPELTSYLISFIKNYLSLLFYYQEHCTC